MCNIFKYWNSLSHNFDNIDCVFFIIGDIKSKVDFIFKFIKVGEQSFFIFIFFKKFFEVGLDLFKGLFIYYINSVDSLFSSFNNNIIILKLYNKLKKLKLKLLPFTIIFIRFENFDFSIIFIIIRVIKIIISSSPNIFNYNNIRFKSVSIIFPSLKFNGIFCRSFYISN